MSKFIDRLLIGFMIVIALGPVAFDYYRGDGAAHWLLAQAANDFDAGRAEEGRKKLERAFKISPSVRHDINFWYQWRRMNPSMATSQESFDQICEMLKSIRETDARADLAEEVANFYSSLNSFDFGLKILESFLPPLKLRTANQNNSIAYLRSLAGRDLETGLIEINLALGTSDDGSYLDTKAWILHKLGRNEEAIEPMEKSISKFRERLQSGGLAKQILKSLDELEKLLDDSSSDLKNELESTSNIEAATTEIESDREDEDGNQNEKATPETKDGDTDRHDSKKLESKSDRPGWMLGAILSKAPQLAPVLKQVLFQIGVLRYHRMCILQELGKLEEAQRDERWLEAFITAERDELH